MADCEKEAIAMSNSPPGPEKVANIDVLRSKMEKCGEDFLKLEKYVNMNFTGRLSSVGKDIGYPFPTTLSPLILIFPLFT